MVLLKELKKTDTGLIGITEKEESVELNPVPSIGMRDFLGPIYFKRKHYDENIMKDKMEDFARNCSNYCLLGNASLTRDGRKIIVPYVSYDKK
jgi:hypothetical protein